MTHNETSAEAVVCTVAVALSSNNWYTFCTLLVVLCIILHSYQVETLQYSCDKLLELSSGIHHLPAEIFISSELYRLSPGILTEVR